MGTIILHMKGNAYEMKLDKCHIVGQCINALNGVYHALFNFLFTLCLLLVRA